MEKSIIKASLDCYYFIFITYKLMLPKLQQSSLANTLRRENLASQIQCKTKFTQARTS